jgi:glucoamylase
MPPEGEAPRDGMIDGSWSTAVKQFFGTSYEAYDSNNGYSSSSPTGPISHVWFTGAKGILTEVMWPSIDTPQIKDNQFLVSDGSSFLFQEKTDATTKVEWLAKGVPAYKITNTDSNHRFVIEKTIFTDPDRDTLIERVRITRNISGLQFYVLHKPAVENTPMGNSAQASLGLATDTLGGIALPAGLYAWQDNSAQAMITDLGFTQVSAGFEGASDGYQDLTHNGYHMNDHYKAATSGNVALMGLLALPATTGVTEFNIAIGFGTTAQAAVQTAQASLSAGVGTLQNTYMNQWSAYQDTIFDLSGVSSDGGNLFRSSVALLKSSEDKTHAGAFVASPTIPWGDFQTDRNTTPTVNGTRTHQTGGYHLVWPRDLYQMATTFMAIKDTKSAIASLNFLKSAQYGPGLGSWQFGFRSHDKNGSFPQNMWTTTEPFWGGLQMDETAMPIILTYRLWKAGQITPHNYWDMVSRAADFIQQFGPWSPQERWEEVIGASPSTIAAEITSLWTAAEIADEEGDSQRATIYRETADSWASKSGDNIDTWAFTTSGSLPGGNYFVRIIGASSFSEIWNPNTAQTFPMANGSGTWPERDIVDGGFLELVRFGIRPALNQHIQQTLPVYDAEIRVDVPGIGPGFRRYLHDRYNYDGDTGQQTDGMLWPFLTGERGHYELESAIESGLSIPGLDSTIQPYIQTMEKMATPTFFLPEQVWDFGTRAGTPTGSAVPLGWTHGEYIKLLRSRNDRAVFDRIPSVANRADLLSQINK